jgi:hypothetical protein
MTSFEIKQQPHLFKEPPQKKSIKKITVRVKVWGWGKGYRKYDIQKRINITESGDKGQNIDSQKQQMPLKKN